MRIERSVTAALFAATLVGCGSADPDPAFLAEVGRLASDRTGAALDPVQLLRTDPAREVEAPAGELTREEAIGRALAHNLGLVASAETLEIAQAQLAQAGLLQNPTLGQTGAFLFPLYAGGGAVSFDFQITQVINTFFTRPYREAAAEAQRYQAGIDLARQAFELAQQVASKYEELAHLLRGRKLAERVADSYRRAAEAAEARAKVGVVPSTDVNRARLQHEDATRQVRVFEAEFRRASRELNWLMGVTSEPRWSLPADAAEAPQETADLPDVARLEELALRFRLDLLRAEFDRRIADAELKLAHAGLFPQLTLGVDAARDSNRNWSAGPSFSVGLPIFDQGTVGVALGEAQKRLVEKSLVALREQVRQDVRNASDQLRIARESVRFFRERLIPQEDENVRLAQRSFELGNTDLDSLLNTLREAMNALQSHEDAVATSFDDLVAFQRAVGLTWTRVVEQSAVSEGAKQ